MSAIITIINVDTTNGTFISSEPHFLITGDSVLMIADTEPTGTINNSLYYVRIIDDTEFSLYSTRNDAKDDINQISVSSEGAAVTFLIPGPKIDNLDFSRSVFGKGLTTSPTYIFTQGFPKATAGPEQLKEYWYLT